MPDDRESPSAGWNEVYDEMAAKAGVEEATHPCPDCGRTCENVLRDVYECPNHGVFRASADGGEERDRSGGDARDESDAGNETQDASNAEDVPDESKETDFRARGPAD